jgi:hypothetical protein
LHPGGCFAEGRTPSLRLRKMARRAGLGNHVQYPLLRFAGTASQLIAYR